MHTKSTAAYTPSVKLTAHRGWYRVQSGTDPNTYYETSANQCDCPARKPCKHQRFVRTLNVAFFVKKGATTPSASLPLATFASGWDDGASAEAGDIGPVWRAAPAAPQPATTSGRCVVCGDEDHYLRAGLCVLCAMDTEAAASCASIDAQLAQAERLLAIKRRAFADTHSQDDSYATLLHQVDTAERAVAALSYSAMRAA